MPAINRRTLLLSSLAAGATGAGAQPEPSLFAQVIKQPTGQNGYEELVRAVDELRRSRLLREAEEMTPAPLSLKERVLRDPPVLRALQLLERGLAKPVRSPRAVVAGSTSMPEFSGFRRLARLLTMRQYVYFAQGAVPEAIGVARACLHLGRVVQTDSVIAGLVGIAISAIGVGMLGAHLDQLSADDCDRLFRVCQEWLAPPSPLPAVIEAERRVGRQSLAQLRAQGAKEAQNALAGLAGADDEPPSPEMKAELERLRANPGAIDAMFADVGRRLDAYYDQLLAAAKRPSWEWAPPDLEADNTIAGQLLAVLAPVLGRLGDHYSRDAARVRLLACHAAILRYRWEYERVPPTLEALDLGDLAQDPFTGQPLRYEPKGRAYLLVSAGPRAEPDDPKAVDGRVPVSVTPSP